MKIEIKTGASISKVLQTTITIPQALCELAKNSLQNGASSCWIELNESSAIIFDDGRGFNPQADSTGLNGFQKYFVFGSSFEQHSDVGLLRLGKMGIGGKIANDRIASEKNPIWQITSKSQSGMWSVDYAPNEDDLYLSDQQIETKKINKVEHSHFSNLDSGLMIHIKNLKSSILLNGWPLDEIKKEISSYFSNSENFKIYINGENLSLKPFYVGTKIPEFSKTFSYKINGKTKKSVVKFELYFARNKESINLLVGERIALYDFAKIKNISYIPLTLIEEELKSSKNPASKNISAASVLAFFHSLMGRIICEDINNVLDESGLPAKDLSHHELRKDHPLTKPLEKAIVEGLTAWIIGFKSVDKAERFSVIDSLCMEASTMVAKIFEQNDLFDFLQSDFGEVEKIILDEKIPNLKENIMETLELEAEEIDLLSEASLDPDESLTRTDNSHRARNRYREREYGKKSQPHEKYIPFSIVDFSQNEIYLNSKIDKGSSFRILINSNSQKFIFCKEKSSILLSLHIAETIIRQTQAYIEPLSLPSDVDKKINKFYEDFLLDLYEKISSIKIID